MGRGRSASKQQMPMCTYGAACKRKDCIYRHDPPAKGPGGAPKLDKSDKVCLAHVAGVCEYGSKCRDVHVSEAEAARMRIRLGAKPCAYGAACHSPHCLYLHPLQEAERALAHAELNASKADNLSDLAQAGAPEEEQGSSALPKVVVAPRPRPLAPNPGKSAEEAIVTLPQWLWRDAATRDAAAFAIADPMERYRAVNEAVRSADNVMDLHFQSTSTFPTILDQLLAHKLRDLGPVWVVTGSGHHVPGQTHQRSGAVLHTAVHAYLSSGRDAGKWLFAVGRDHNGYHGAFQVRPVTLPRH